MSCIANLDDVFFPFQNFYFRPNLKCQSFVSRGINLWINTFSWNSFLDDAFRHSRFEVSSFCRDSHRYAHHRYAHQLQFLVNFQCEPWKIVLFCAFLVQFCCRSGRHFGAAAATRARALHAGGVVGVARPVAPRLRGRKLPIWLYLLFCFIPSRLFIPL